MQRGLVTPSRTALVMSTHRVYAMSEKTAMADGRADSSQLWSLALQGARQVVGFDMAEVAQQQGSVISAVLFGALAASGALPFARQAYEDTIRAGGIGVKTSLAAFDAGYAMAQLPPQPPCTDVPAAAPRRQTNPARCHRTPRHGPTGCGTLTQQPRAAPYGRVCAAWWTTRTWPTPSRT